MRKIVFLIVTLLIPINANAQMGTVKGYGAVECGEFLDDFDDKFHR